MSSLLARLRRAVKRRLFLDPGRDRRQQPERVVAALGIEPGEDVADLGSGPGYFSLRFARAAGPGGRVYAVDTDPDMLAIVEVEARRAGLDNVVAVRAEPDRVDLPGAVDLVFLANAYHHLPDRERYLRRLSGLVRDGGRLAVVEPRPAGLAGFFGHATDPARVRAELEAAGWRLEARFDFLPSQSFQVFRRGGEAEGSVAGPEGARSVPEGRTPD